MKSENRVTLTTSGPVDPFGNVALVDPDRLAELAAFDWFLEHGRGNRSNYGRRQERVAGKVRVIFLHQAVFGPLTDGLQIDHRNRNGMDCRQENLRLATAQQQMRNRGKQRKPSSSRFKGVCFNKSEGKWHATARLSRRQIQLGLFDPTPEGEIAAARVYDDFARMWFGEFASLNFPNDSTAPPIEYAQAMQKQSEFV